MPANTTIGPDVVMESQFWNQEVHSARSLEGYAHMLPCTPPPLPSTQPSGLVRSQQVLVIHRKYPAVPVLPAYDGWGAGTAREDGVDADGGGGVVFDRVLWNGGNFTWWGTVLGRLRAQQAWKRFQEKRADAASDSSGSCAGGSGSSAGGSGASSLQACLWQVLQDKALYSLSARARGGLGDWTAVTCTAEVPLLDQLFSRSGNLFSRLKSAVRGRLRLSHRLPRHKLVVDAVWNGRFLDGEGTYCNIPRLVAGSICSTRAPGGLRYRAGVHYLPVSPAGRQQSNQDTLCFPPVEGLQEGVHAQAAVTLERIGTVLRFRPRKRLGLLEAESLLIGSPGVSLSTVVGALARVPITERLVGSLKDYVNGVRRPAGEPAEEGVAAGMLGIGGGGLSALGPIVQPFTGVFSSFGVTAQVGHFARPLLDYTTLSARIDLGASVVRSGRLALAPDGDTAADDDAGCGGDAVASASASAPTSATAAPGRLSLWGRSPVRAVLTGSLQQQVFGPVRARMDVRYDLDRQTEAGAPKLLELGYGLDYIMPDTKGAARVALWYSHTRKEGMIELRAFEI